MARHFHEEIRQLRQKLIEMGFAAEDAVARACDAFFNSNPKLAQQVIQGDPVLNRLEIEIDEAGYSLFALNQPVAFDLRQVLMMLKINTTLERVGDHAVNIAQKTLQVLEEPPIYIDFQFEAMARSAGAALRAALDAFLKEDAGMAREVLKQDDEIDRFNDQLFEVLKKYVEKNPHGAGAAFAYLSIGHNLERIGDLAGNIAEDVIFLKQGREVRHRIELTES
ncbi:MAG: phosphate transport system regulatory protein PhoU [Omnitrophica bacterium GWA2_52_12]|nr:MAG: phosphate transport system regulatory protein PhoU [Omnitrophica bacterium GWA2_52_12]